MVKFLLIITLHEDQAVDPEELRLSILDDYEDTIADIEIRDMNRIVERYENETQ